MQKARKKVQDFPLTFENKGMRTSGELLSWGKIVEKFRQQTSVIFYWIFQRNVQDNSWYLVQGVPTSFRLAAF